MKTDTIKTFASFAFAFTVMGMAFYGLVLYDLQLDPLVQGALIAWGGAAIAFVFGQQIAKATVEASQQAYNAGLQTPMPTITTTAGPPPSVTVTPPDPTASVPAQDVQIDGQP